MAKYFTAAILGGVGLAVLAGCTQDKVVGRYSTATCISTTNDAGPCHNVIPEADVSIVTIATPTASTGAAAVSGNAPTAPAAAAPTPLVSATNFPDHALAEYIKVLSDSKLSPDAATLRQNIAAALKAAATAPATATATVNDQTVLHRTMIVTVAKNALQFNPADRIEATDVHIEPQNGVTVTSWDTAATQYTTINAGTIQLTQTRSTGQSLTAGAPTGAPITGSLGFTANQGETRVENYNATSQVDNLTVSVGGGKMRIRRQGGIGIDLTGNTIIKVDLTVPPELAELKPVFSISGNYLDKTGKWATPKSLNLKEDIVYVATKAQDISANVTLTYTMRHIVSGDETLEEKDDTVQEVTKVAKPVNAVLVPGRQVSPPSYTLWANEGSGSPVYVSRPTSSRNAPLCIESYEAAKDLLAYIQHGNRTHPETLGTATLGFSVLSASGFTPLKPQGIDGLTVKPECP